MIAGRAIMASNERGGAARPTDPRSPGAVPDLIDKAVLVFYGLLLAAFTQLIAFISAWGGEGWGVPFPYTLLLFITFPVALLRLANGAGRGIVLDLLLLAAALAASILVAWETRAQEYMRFLNAWTPPVPVAAYWLGFWLLSPALTAATIARRLLRREAD